MKKNNTKSFFMRIGQADTKHKTIIVNVYEGIDEQ